MSSDFKTQMADHRQRLANWVKAELSGSRLKDGDEVHFLPIDRYVSAVLFPVDRQGVGLDPAGELDGDDIDEIEPLSENPPDDTAPIVRRRYVPPSSVGFSFFVADKDWQIQLMASAKCFVGFERNADGEYAHNYHACDLRLKNESVIVNADNYQYFDNVIFDGRAKFDVRTSAYGDGVIVTATLINNQELGDIANGADNIGKQIKQEQAQKTLFAVEFSCVMDKGVVGNYPSVDYALLSDDEQEIELQYSHKKVYAVGHGAAVHWRTVDGVVREIFSDFMPIAEVPQVTADLDDDNLKQVLSMAFLATADHKTNVVCDELGKFANLYHAWIQGQMENLTKISPKHRQAGERLIARMQTAYQRMQMGINKIASDKQVACAFSYANLAMQKQMTHPSKSWRAFQLAFILTTLSAISDENDDFRETVDLIWFATGGGKTEAYLGLTAFQILYRRLKYGSAGGGTTVLMRYTLKLLTTQQFLRACRLICALESVRVSSGLFGDEWISIGLWVGESASPNKITQAAEIYQKCLTKNDFSPFVLDKCPCCDTPFARQNIRIDTANTRFEFICYNASCEFYQQVLPCQVVDDALYKNPPTLLLATIDKLAMLAWEERSAVFFGNNGNRPPELIIQDELHLIANALGSVAGVYESALQTVLTSRGVKPKYIASTATIKEASSQVRRLFAKNLAIFPPQGLSADDAFFARTVDLSVRAGRLYVGYFAPLLNRQKNLAPLAALLLIAPFVLFGQNREIFEAWADAWWTTLVYHGSLKGVGNSHTAFDFVVRKKYEDYDKEFFDNRILEYDEQRFFEQFLKDKIKNRSRPTVKQLTSNSTASENARIFGQLALPYANNDAVDVVLATNMVATGLDVARLSMMIINGQPITTAEYIQASSRVGRSDVAGVVFVNYYREQARSLSHYESFYPYHQSFYRFVEPTSVTPYTQQARKRALHAALVIALRHSVDKMADNGGAANFDPNDDKIAEVLAVFKNYCQMADSERAADTLTHIDRLIDEWQTFIQKEKEKRNRIYYNTKDKGTASLLYRHNAEQAGLWATLQNMRNVEHSGILRLV